MRISLHGVYHFYDFVSSADFSKSTFNKQLEVSSMFNIQKEKLVRYSKFDIRDLNGEVIKFLIAKLNCNGRF